MCKMEDERFAAYLPGIRRRRIEEQRGWRVRRERAWERAQRAAILLRGFGATRIIVFGSLVRTGPYDTRSDIDLAEEGISPAKFYSAYAKAAAAVEDFELDVVDLADCQPALRKAVLDEGSSL